ncbi:ribosome-associated heat shock protein Hsp15 [Pseudorhizobium tarimense]|uniref:Ribosome-associated heat shock protein Hsp15 n=1 Tax=Pseudorhizobium tarimense TaxID=1079109 RepID=A0ABV2H808_9HYPH|nr:RNA-binding S4 domain-containing protein [Pseudorhizobium tarimense]MCJ8519902.1 RNA-binding S4 domain-containing protein [Pseudorhizobium tarimense]
MADEQPQGGSQQRIDKWLFFARLIKSRSLAQALIAAGGVTANAKPVLHSSQLVRPGDRIELRLEHRDVDLVVRVCGSRRGPPNEARLLYEELPQNGEPKRLTLFERAQRSIRP